MKVSIVLATCLSCIFVIASAIDYPTVTFATDSPSVGGYQRFVKSIRDDLQSGSKSHGIAILRKPLDITDTNRYILVNLTNSEKKLAITVAVNVDNVYVVAYKSGTKSFFLNETSRTKDKELLFPNTAKADLKVSSNYNSLGGNQYHRMTVGLGIPALGNAIETLNTFGGRTENTAFKDSFLIVIQMIAEAARFEFIKLKIEKHITDEYKPKPDTISFENKWDKLSEQIQKSGTDGVFEKEIKLQNEDGSEKVVSNVAQVQSDITLMHYHHPTNQLEEEKFGNISDE